MDLLIMVTITVVLMVGFTQWMLWSSEKHQNKHPQKH